MVMETCINQRIMPFWFCIVLRKPVLLVMMINTQQEPVHAKHCQVSLSLSVAYCVPTLTNSTLASNRCKNSVQNLLSMLQYYQLFWPSVPCTFSQTPLFCWHLYTAHSFSTQNSMANVPFHTLHPLSGKNFLRLYGTQNLFFLSNPP